MHVGYIHSLVLSLAHSSTSEWSGKHNSNSGVKLLPSVACHSESNLTVLIVWVVLSAQQIISRSIALLITTAPVGMQKP